MTRAAGRSLHNDYQLVIDGLPINQQLGGSISRDSHLRPVYQIRVGIVDASAYRLYRRRPVLKLAPQLRVDRCVNASVNADEMAKFNIILSRLLSSDRHRQGC